MQTPATDAELAEALGLEDYQLEIYHVLLAQADERGIPRDVLPILAKYLERIDMDQLIATPNEAAETLGVDPTHLANLIRTDPQWMHPFVWARAKSGETAIRLWLAAKVRAFRRARG